MIRVDGETCEIELDGEFRELMVEMTAIIHSLYWKAVNIIGEESAIDLFNGCLDMAMVSDEEIADRVENDIWERMVGDDE